VRRSLHGRKLETGGPARADKQMEKSPDTIERALRGRRPVVMSGS
jgi:hypothetical protein